MSVTIYEAHWVECTPEWISNWDACASTIRRPKLVSCAGDGGECADPHDHLAASGHEHLMGRPAGLAGVLQVSHPVIQEGGVST